MPLVLLVAAHVVLVAAGIVTAGAVAFIIAAAMRTLSFRIARTTDPASWPSMTVVKPLCGSEPLLREAICTFLDQSYPGSLKFVFGVHDADDPAAHLIRELIGRYPQIEIVLVSDDEYRSPNRKVSNLINMWSEVGGEIVVISDSDVLIRPGALMGLATALQPAKVGAVTSLYFGRVGDPRSFWDKMGSLYLDAWFTPSALMHSAVSGASVCYGPLTAIKRPVLEAGGGVHSLGASLADDTELGHLVRRQGMTVAFAEQAVETVVAEPTLGALFMHELRWARTIRALQPLGYVASIVMHPGPLPWVLAIGLHSIFGVLVAASIPILRWVLVSLIYHRFDHVPAVRPSALTLLIREQIYFCVWLRGFFATDVVWKGRRLRIKRRAPGRAKRFEEAGLRLAPRLET